MTVIASKARMMECLVGLGGDIAINEAMTEQCNQLKAIAEETGSIFGPAMQTLANSQRIRAMDLRCRVAALAEEQFRASRHDD